MRISIRLSILVLFLTLLVVVSGAIIIESYLIANKILIASTKSMVDKTVKLVDVKVASYLNVIDDKSKTSARLIDNGALNPDNILGFQQYLMDVVTSHKHVFGIYYGTPAGNFNRVERYQDDFIDGYTRRTVQPSYNYSKQVDSNGKVILRKKIFKLTYDHRVRPWYKLALQKKKPVWTSAYLYEFSQMVQAQKQILGLTAATPLYAEDGRLRGVFGVDVVLTDLTKFVNNLAPTRNTVIFLMDDKGDLLSSDYVREIGKGNRVKYQIMNVKDFPSPWIKKSYEVYKQNQQEQFMFSYKNQDYMAAYSPMKLNPYNKWRLVIVFPKNDVTGMLMRNILFLISIACSLLLIGIMLAYFISTKISKSITDLSSEAESIKDLDLKQAKRDKTYIKEIFDIRVTFDAMRAAIKSFFRYVPSVLVKSLIKSGVDAKIGGKNRAISVFFSDIKNFSSWAEAVSPIQLIQDLSDYFDYMTRVIHENHGVVDKFIGDAIMAFWGAPAEDEDHALHACKAAVEQITLLKAFNAAKSGDRSPIIIRIGINTGEAIVGNMGSHDRLSYTAIGDTVNLASRLEGLGKIYGTTILVSQYTYEKVKNSFRFRLVDNVAVKGKVASCRIYELLYPEIDIFGDKLDVYNAAFAEAFELYQKGDWQRALERFTVLKNDFPADKLLDLYIKRCQEVKPQNWDGVWRYTSSCEICNK